MKTCRTFCFITALVFAFYSCGDAEKNPEPTHEEICLFSPEEIKSVEEIKEEIIFSIYLTGDIPNELKKIEKETKKLLEDLHYHNAKISFSFIDPYNDEHGEHVEQVMKNLTTAGVPYTELERKKNGKTAWSFIFPGGTVSCGGNKFPLCLFDVKHINEKFDYTTLVKNVTNALEFKFLTLLKKVTSTKKPRIAFLTGHGEADSHHTHAIEKTMGYFYETERVSIKNPEGKYDIHSLENYDGLIICKPVQPFVDREKFIIDQFIMRGGKTIWMIDPMYVDENSLAVDGETIGLSIDLGINEMLFSYGARMNSEIVTEENCAPIAFSDSQINIYNWYFYPLIKPDTNYKYTNGLGFVKLNYPGTIDFISSDSSIHSTVLLKTTKKSKSYKAPVRINSKMALINDGFKNQVNSEKSIALLLDGSFDSFFKNTFLEELIRESVFKKKSETTKMLVIADGDMIINHVDSFLVITEGKEIYKYKYGKLNMEMLNINNPDGSQKYNYGNMDFFMNVLDKMMYE